MIKFTKPINLNGAELISELQAAGLSVTQPPFVDGNNDLWLDIANKDENKASAVVVKHNGTIVAPALSIEDKLASVGISIADLKAALG